MKQVNQLEKIIGLIGHPVQHSLSPLMHNEEFKQFHLPYRYSAFDVGENHLSQAVEGIRALGIAGCNVTIPYKEQVLPLLDEIDEEAASIGAVNTIINENGKLVGYNTDGRGFLSSLIRTAGHDCINKSILLIGAGGSAKAILMTLLNHGAKDITIANRNINRASDLKSFTSVETIEVMSIEDAEQSIQRHDIIINTTPAGMDPYIDDIPLSLDLMNSGTVLVDIIYTPIKTKWLQIGEQKGAIIENGVHMFVMQGALAFEYWTSILPDIERMKRKVNTALKERSFNYVKR
jgi:shikimate dehydrogenase